MGDLRSILEVQDLRSILEVQDIRIARTGISWGLETLGIMEIRVPKILDPKSLRPSDPLIIPEIQNLCQTSMKPNF